MAGLYIHVPFCKQACLYCDFHFSVNTQGLNQMVEAICLEIALRKNYIKSQAFDTVYFGGGTPSLLSRDQLQKFMDTAIRTLSIEGDGEVTLEANPDDLTFERLSMYKELGINRLSIGVQSFSDAVLTFLNRSHDAETALRSIALARKAGFDDINIDLMYAIPHQDRIVCLNNIEDALQYHPEHISAYALTIEDKTVFGQWVSKQQLIPVTDEESALQFEQFSSKLEAEGYLHYEISNFCRPGHSAVHNSNYWAQVPYLGVGPGAHSFDGISRQWNVRNNGQYIKAIHQHKIPCQKEILSTVDLVNECVFTSLRTSRGCNLALIKERYGIDVEQRNQVYLRDLHRRGLAVLDNSMLSLTRKGRLLADEISAGLFMED